MRAFEEIRDLRHRFMEDTGYYPIFIHLHPADHDRLISEVKSVYFGAHGDATNRILGMAIIPLRNGGYVPYCSGMAERIGQ